MKKLFGNSEKVWELIILIINDRLMCRNRMVTKKAGSTLIWKQMRMNLVRFSYAKMIIIT